MTASVAGLVRDSLPLVGVVVGGILGAWLNGLGDTRRWRREWVMDLSKQQADFLADAIQAVDRQYVILGKCMDAALGRRLAVPRPDIQAADAEWGRVLSLRLLRAQPAVQDAMTAYDQARSDCVEAINGKDPDRMAATYGEVDAQRTGILLAANETLRAMGKHVSRHVLPLRVRAWRTVTRQPADYL